MWNEGEKQTIGGGLGAIQRMDRGGKKWEKSLTWKQTDERVVKKERLKGFSLTKNRQGKEKSFCSFDSSILCLGLIHILICF